MISLLPAATEIVAAVAGVDALVGVTHECDWPPAVREVERVTASPVDAHAAPGAVDAQVRELAGSGASLFHVHAERIARLAPDVVVTQALCDVCAVSETDVRAIAAAMDRVPAVVTMGATTLDGVLDETVRVAEALGRREAGEALVAGLRERMRGVHETLKATRAPRPRVAMLEWTDPVYAAGHWVPEMVRRAGGTDVLASPGEHSRPRDVREVRDARPDVLVIGPCGYDAVRARAAAATLLAREEWAWARPGEPGAPRVWAMDGNALLSRPGPRLADGVLTLAAIFSPALFPPPHRRSAAAIVPHDGRA